MNSFRTWKQYDNVIKYPRLLLVHCKCALLVEKLGLMKMMDSLTSARR